ncbi:hypothetical protein D3C86_2056790 [compost metagenome]
MDFRVREVAALHLAEQQAGEGHVGNVSGVAGDLVEQVGALDAVSDHGVGHHASSLARALQPANSMASAVLSMASMILV